MKFPEFESDGPMENRIQRKFMKFVHFRDGSSINMFIVQRDIPDNFQGDLSRGYPLGPLAVPLFWMPQT